MQSYYKRGWPNLVVLCGDLDPVSKKGACSKAISHLRVYDQGEQRDEQEEEAGGQDVHHVQHQGGSEEQDLKQGLLWNCPNQAAQGPGWPGRQGLGEWGEWRQKKGSAKVGRSDELLVPFFSACPTPVVHTVSFEFPTTRGTIFLLWCSKDIITFATSLLWRRSMGSNQTVAT